MPPRRTILIVAACWLSAGLAACAAANAQTNGGGPMRPVPSATFARGGNAAEIPAQFIDHLVFLPVRINESQPCLFLLDSTAAITSIDPSRAAELGIRSGEGALLELPGLAFSMPELEQTPRQNFAAQVGRNYEGTLGRDFFNSVVVEIDYARQTVRLYDPASYQFTVSKNGKSFHLAATGQAPVIQAKLTASNGKTLDADFAINTAATASVLISQQYAKTHPFVMHTKTIPDLDLLSDGPAEAVLGRLKAFQIGGVQIDDPIAEFPASSATEKSNSRLAGDVGAGMLRRFSVIFDYPHAQVVLEPNTEIRSNELEDMSGISLIAKGPGLRTFEVTQVRKGTPGADAGLQNGDIIAGIDEDPAADLSLVEIRNLFRQIDHPYKLTVERNGKTLTLTIKLRRLI
jgi:hypothetical protein